MLFIFPTAKRAAANPERSSGQRDNFSSGTNKTSWGCDQTSQKSYHRHGQETINAQLSQACDLTVMSMFVLK